MIAPPHESAHLFFRGLFFICVDRSGLFWMLQSSLSVSTLLCVLIVLLCWCIVRCGGSSDGRRLYPLDVTRYVGFVFVLQLDAVCAGRRLFFGVVCEYVSVPRTRERRPWRWKNKKKKRKSCHVAPRSVAFSAQGFRRRLRSALYQACTCFVHVLCAVFGLSIFPASFTTRASPGNDSRARVCACFDAFPRFSRRLLSLFTTT